MDKEKRPKLNIVANIVNSHFLDSDYQGKDWEVVRKSLIKELDKERHDHEILVNTIIVEIKRIA